MSDPIAEAADILFPQDGSNVIDVKSVVGGSDNFSAREFASEIVEAHQLMKAGKAQKIELEG